MSEDNECDADALGAAIWDAAVPMSRSALQVAVHRCRQLLAEERCDDVRIETTPTGYRLVMEGVTSDLAAFTEFVEQPAPDIRSLEAALALWRGPVLSDEPATADHFRIKIRALERQRRAATLALVRGAIAAGQPARALESLERVARADALDEELGAAQIEALGAAGHLAEAVREFGRISAALRDELGVLPGPRLRAAYERYVMAEHAPRAHSGPCLLPAQLADFTGRGVQLDCLAELLRGRRGVVVVSGPPGVGKTTLAIQAAHALRPLFPGGLLHCDLQGFTRPLKPSEVLARLLRALGVHPARVPASLEERATLLRSKTSDSPVLIIADSAGSEAQVRPLLPGVSGTLLVTSRSPLEGLESAQRLELENFTAAEAVSLIRTVIGPARAQGHDAALTAIADYCGYLPLAVRIAAVRLAARPRWPVERMAGLLADERSRLDQLRAGDLDVRAAIELSYRHLGAAGQLALRMVAELDVPDFPDWVCGAVLDSTERAGAEIADMLARAYLLQVVEVDVAGQVRYGMHDLVRGFARERALCDEPAEQRAAAVRRVATRWLSLAEAADQHLRGSVTGLSNFAPAAVPVDAMSWFERERSSLAGAIRQAPSAGAPEISWRLVEASKAYLLLSDRAAELSAWANGGLVAAAQACDLAATAQMHTAAAEAAHYLNAYQEALQHCAAAADALERVPSNRAKNRPARLAAMLYVSGSVREQLGQVSTAFVDVLRAVRLAHSCGDLATEGLAMTLLARMLDEYRSAREAGHFFDRAITALRRNGSTRELALGLRRLAMFHERGGRIEAAYCTYTECLELVRSIRDPEGEAYLQMHLGTLLVEHPTLGDPVPHLHFASEQMHRFDDARGRARVLQALARHQLRHDKPAEALSMLQDALSLVSDVPRLCIPALRSSAEAYAALGRLPEAVATCRSALDAAERIGANMEAAGIRVLLSNLSDLTDKRHT